MAEEQNAGVIEEAVEVPVDDNVEVEKIEIEEEPVETENPEAGNEQDDVYASESELASENPEEIKQENANKKKKTKKKRARPKLNLLKRFTPLELSVLIGGLIIALLLIAGFYYLYDSARKSNKAIPQNGLVASDTDKSWETYIISGNSPAAKEYAVTTSAVTGTNGVQVDYRITKDTVNLLEALKKHAENTGENVNILAGYTSVEDYLNAYNALVQDLKDQGYSTANATAVAQQRMMIPGTDEHSTGLLINFGLNDVIDPNAFAASDSYQWLLDHAHEYGYILRYPEGKDQVTLHPYDPSAFRYVGVDAATMIKDTGQTLEEYNAQVAAEAAAEAARQAELQAQQQQEAQQQQQNQPAQ